ncbi:CocE/NonD family hydrolase [Marivivens marinus]|uniref:CocE/NonD family hydrolase n=1 Tax=Marivivens marinus TaxID=3110173 RepID=UPI003B84B22C
MTAIRTDFPHRVVETPDMAIPMPDGTTLSARVWMPEDAGQNPVPAILEYIPYRKRDGTLPRDEMMHPWWAGHGYATVRVDMRGNGDSDGLMHDEYTETELQDACDVIAWLAAQVWCTGAVGMMGKSWGGFNCLQTAFLQPPALKAVISVCSTVDRYADDVHFKGGCLLGENIGWGAVMLSYSSRPPDPALRQGWRQTWLDRLEANPFLAPVWAAHQSRDAYWQHGSVCEDYSRITAKVLSFGGWADNYMNTVSHLVTNLPGQAKGIVGPWVHQYPHTATPGPRIGFLQEALRFWDRWLKGIENGAEDDPAYRAYMLDSEPPDPSTPARKGTWVAEADWPTPRTDDRVLYLTGAGLAGDAGPLSTVVHTPQHHGLYSGEFFPMGLNAEMPADQAPEDAMATCFDTAPLDAPLALLGAPRLRLRLSSDAPRANLVARLCDVAPDGSSVRICHGMLNLTHRDSRADPTDLTPGEEVDVDLVLDQCGYRLAAGHRLRIALSTTYWPFIWPTAHDATLTLSAGSLSLPVHPGAGADECHFEPPETAMPWAHRTVSDGHATRRIEEDMLTGTRTLIVEDFSSDVENLDHGLITGHDLTERWTIHPNDPLSARSDIRWEQRLSRGDWSVRTVAETRMWADAAVLHMTATLTAWEGEEIVFHRDYTHAVPRKHL